MHISGPVHLLLITWNRREYVEKTIKTLLADPSDFHLYCWDNASSDGTADLIASIDDPRVAKQRFSKENVKQREPFLWFLEQSDGDLVGKIDDDILLPPGWTQRIAPILRREPRFGTLGCWPYMPEDWDESLASHKIIELAGVRVFRNPWVAGHSFLARRDCLKQFISPPTGYGLPINQFGMTRAGLINGYPLPLLQVHNMDDPRSPHCLMNRNSGLGEHAALTARVLGFESAEAYGQWIAQDARQIQRDPIEIQLRRHSWRNDRTLVGRARRKVLRLIGQEL